MANLTTEEQNVLFRRRFQTLLYAEDPEAVSVALDSLEEVCAGMLPELTAAKGMLQNAYHEHDVYEHTCHVLMQAVEAEGIELDVNLRVAALLHDLGKVSTRTEDENGKVQFHGHEDKSAEIAKRLLRDEQLQADIEAEFGDCDLIVQMIACHMQMKAAGPNGQDVSDKALRKFVRRITGDTENKTIAKNRLNTMLLLLHADNMSHAPEHCMPYQADELQLRIKNLPSEEAVQQHKPVREMLYAFMATTEGKKIVRTFPRTRTNVAIAAVAYLQQPNATPYLIAVDEVDVMEWAFIGVMDKDRIF